jgi:hypothetical protein
VKGRTPADHVDPVTDQVWSELLRGAGLPNTSQLSVYLLKRRAEILNAFVERRLRVLSPEISRSVVPKLYRARSNAWAVIHSDRPMLRSRRTLLVEPRAIATHNERRNPGEFFPAWNAVFYEPLAWNARCKGLIVPRAFPQSFRQRFTTSDDLRIYERCGQKLYLACLVSLPKVPDHFRAFTCTQSCTQSRRPGILTDSGPLHHLGFGWWGSELRRNGIFRELQGTPRNSEL